MIIAHQALRQLTPITDPKRDRCAGCANEVSAQLQVLAERVAASVTLPRLMLICQTCQRTFVVAAPLTRKAVV